MNINAYLNRINFDGERTPSLHLLSQLQKAHLLHIPFENLDIHIGRPIQLDINKVFRKVIDSNRGGFCYELNGLFYELLKSLGFNCNRISARFYEESKGLSPEFEHMAILVQIGEQEYLTDVGFGKFSFAPLLIKPDIIQEDARGSFRIKQYDETYVQVSKKTEGIWKSEYLFTRTARNLTDFSARCHYQQTSPDSHFTQKRLCSLATEQGRITITGDILKINEGMETREVKINNEKEFDAYLYEYFAMRL